MYTKRMFALLSFYYSYYDTQNCVNGRNGGGRMHSPIRLNIRLKYLQVKSNVAGFGPRKTRCNNERSGWQAAGVLPISQETGGGERRTEKHPSDDEAFRTREEKARCQRLRGYDECSVRSPIRTSFGNVTFFRVLAPRPKRVGKYSAFFFTLD